LLLKNPQLPLFLPVCDSPLKTHISIMITLQYLILSDDKLDLFAISITVRSKYFNIQPSYLLQVIGIQAPLKIINGIYQIFPSYG
jgi:hypothetical protein